MSDSHETTGTVLAVLGYNNYRVEIFSAEGESLQVICHLSGKMRRHKISVVPGDKVRLELPPPYDLGRITFRER